MGAESHSTVDELLERLAEGDAAASEDLLALLYGELHGIARKLMSDQRAGHTLQTTALINEAWMRLTPGSGSRWQNRRHFVRAAARAMRHVLVDHARRRTAKKRQRDKARPFEEGAFEYWSKHPAELLALNELLENLGERDPEMLKVVELRYFGGLTLEETAAATGLTVRQVHIRWTFARGWLRRALEQGDADA